MNIEEGRKSLFYLVEKYLVDTNQVKLLRNYIFSDPPRVPVRDIAEQLSNGAKQVPLTQDDNELLDDLFYYFG